MQNQIRALALLPKLSEQQLIQALQRNDGSLPTYALMAELQARKKRSDGFSGAQAPQTSVKDDMVSQSGGGGLQSLAPQGAPMAQTPQGPPMQGMAPQGAPMQGMAGGGLTGWLANDNYSDAPMYGAGMGPFVPEEETYEEKRERARREFLQRIGSKIGSYFGKPEPRAVASTGAGGGRGSVNPGLNDVWPAPTSGIGAAGAKPAFDLKGSDVSSVLAQLAQAARNAKDPAEKAAIEEEMRRQIARSDTKPPADTFWPSPRLGDSSVAVPPGGIRSVSTPPVPDAPVSKAAEWVDVKPRSMEEMLKDLPADTSIADALKSIKEGDTSAKDKEQARWEALARAGIGMATTPGNFMSGLARGAGAGLDSYGQSQNEIRRMQNEREKELRTLGIAQGRQNLERYGIGRQAISDQLRTDIANQTGRITAADKNTDNVFNVWKANLDAQVRREGFVAGKEEAGIRAAASPTELQFKYVKEAGDLYKDAISAAKIAMEQPFVKMTLKTDADVQKHIRKYVDEAFRAHPHLKPYVNLDAASTAPGFVAPPSGVKAEKL